MSTMKEEYKVMCPITCCLCKENVEYFFRTETEALAAEAEARAERHICEYCTLFIPIGTA